MSAALLEILADHIATLEACGFGGEGDINGADAVDAVNEHFEALRNALDAVRYPLDPIGYAARVRALEAEGLCTSDAQGVADAEFSRAGNP